MWVETRGLGAHPWSRTSLKGLALLGLLLAGVAGAQTNEDDDLFIDGRIVGGELAVPGEFPFFAHWGGCGASLIHDDVILTAAHCAGIDKDTVLVGAYTRRTEEGPPINSVNRKVRIKSIHPQWNRDSVRNDFLLIGLDEKVDLPKIELGSSRNVPSAGTELTVIGFGATEPRVEISFDEVEHSNSTIRSIFFVRYPVLPDDAEEERDEQEGTG